MTNLESGDCLSLSHSEATMIQNGQQSGAFYSFDPYQSTDPSMQYSHVPTSLGGYYLSPSPSFDAIFDDLLEGKGKISRKSSREKNESDKSDRDAIDQKTAYLKELFRDERNLSNIPYLAHLRPLLTREIVKTRRELRCLRAETSDQDTPAALNQSMVYFCGKFEFDSPEELPQAVGPIECVTDTVHIPIDQYPEYNFVGRLVGPRGITIKQIEQQSECQIVVRGRCNYEEEPDEPLHVQISAKDHKERAVFKVQRAKRLIERLLVPVEYDELKEAQLHELVMIRQYWRRQRANKARMQNQNMPMMPHPPPSFDHLGPAQAMLTPAVVSATCNGYYLINDPEFNGLIPMVWPHNNTY